MTSPLPRNPARAFTLVELLVALSIVAVLAALALPALNAARQGGLMGACAQNLSRIGVASGLYSADHNGEIVPRFVNYDEPDGGYWFQNLKAYFAEDKNVVGVKVAPFFCPADRHLNLTQFLTSGSYAYNYRVVGDPTIPLAEGQAPLPRRLSQFPHPAAVLFAAESGVPSSVDLDTSPDPRRHPGGKVNVLWLDGHVSRLDAVADLGPGSRYYDFEETQK